jgi:uncharacterized protein
MSRGILMALVVVGLAMGAVVPAHASFDTTVHKSPLKGLASTLVQGTDSKPHAQDIGAIRLQAHSGDAHAQMLLGSAYLFGVGLPRDVDKGVHWLNLAAAQGNHDGKALLGAYLVFMSGNKSSRDQGIIDLEQLAQQGRRHDVTVYGIALLMSSGPPSDWARGFSELQKAARLGDPYAPLMLGIAYTDGRGVAWNPFKAVHWYRQALSKPLPGAMHCMAQYQLGIAYIQGLGVPKDMARGTSLIRKAAEGGSPGGAYTLSMLYLKGMGVARDTTKARKWLLTAAREGLPIAQFQLGMDYTLGRKTGRDYKHGIPWLERAAHQDFAKAYAVLGIMRRMGWGVPMDAHAAAKMWMHAARLGDGASAYMLSNIWINQHDHQGDTYAVMWLAIAVKLGFGKARHELQVVEKKFRKSDIQKGLVMAQAWLKLRAREGVISSTRP